MNHERMATLLRCPACGSPMRYGARIYSYYCEGDVLHTYRIHREIADLVEGESERRQRKVERAFERVSGWTYEKNVTGATPVDRFTVRMMWGTDKFIPLLFEMLESVASDCEPGYFLDIPVGTAVFTAGAYSRQPNHDFVAADYSMGMLASALEKVRAEDFGNVMLVRVDAARLPFVDDTFSGVMTMNGISAFPDKEKSLDELARVLKPGGKLAGSDFVRGERFASDILVGRLLAAFGWFTRPIYTEEELLEALKERGVGNLVTKKVGPILFFSGRKEGVTC